MKPRLAFVDHSFHAKTRSGDFLRSLFSAHYDIVDFWDESWNDGKAITADEVNSSAAEVVYFFQSLLPLAELRRLKGRIVWAPMYDSVPLHNRAFWLELGTLPIKLMTFSSTLHTLLLSYGLDSIYAQYWFDPDTVPHVTDYSSPRVFFWQRTDITFAQVKALLGETAIERCVVKLNPDPRYAASWPSAEDIAKYHIEVVKAGFTVKENYLALLQSCNVFICPRRLEGIGMSFLEAMSMGLVPVGMNQPTMNEYIMPNKTGWLWNDLQPLDFSQLPVFGLNVQHAARAGYKDWHNRQTELLQFVQTPSHVVRTHRWYHWLWFKTLYGWYVCGQIWRRVFGND